MVLEMKENLTKVDSGESIEFSKNASTVKYNSETGKYSVFGKKGVELEISEGQILSSTLWGTGFRLDESVERSFKKKFVLEYTKNKIMELYDSQVLKWGEESDINQGGTSRAYEGLAEMEDKDLEELPNGILAEKMFSSFFTRICYNLDELPFEFKRADVYDDVENKVDFIFKIKHNEQTTEKQAYVSEDGENIGVQFTTANSNDVIEKKKKQIERSNFEESNVDDLVLVSFPISEIREVLQQYQESGKNDKLVKTPDCYFSEETKEKLIKAVLDKLPEKLHIDFEQVWNSIKKNV